MADINIDNLWISTGNFGRYHKEQLFLYATAMVGPAYAILVYVFAAYRPSFNCKLPINGSILLTGGMFENKSNQDLIRDSCKINVLSNMTNTSSDILALLPCSYGYTYNTKQMTIVTEWDLVCTNEGGGELTQSVLTAGQIVGGVIFTQLADLYGRKKIYVSIGLLTLMATTLISLSPNYYVYLLMKFSSGALLQGFSLAMYIYVYEMIPRKFRVYMGVFDGFNWAFSATSLALIGYLLRFYSWRILHLATGLVCIINLFTYWLCDESLRWLSANGRTEQFKKVINKIAITNGANNDDTLQSLQKCTDKKIKVDNKLQSSSQKYTEVIYGNVSTVQLSTKCCDDKVYPNSSLSCEETKLDNCKLQLPVNCTENRHCIDHTLRSLHKCSERKKNTDNVLQLSQRCSESNVLPEKVLQSPQKCSKGTVSSTYDNEFQYEIENSVVNTDTRLFINDESSLAERTDVEEEILFEKLPNNVTSSKLNENLTVCDIFRNKILFVMTLVWMFTWFTSSLTYYGLLLSSVQWEGNRFLNFFISGILDIPSIVLYWIFISRINRRKALAIFQLMAGIPLIISALLLYLKHINKSFQYAAVACSFFGKVGIGAVMFMLYVYTPETYPTNLRNTGLGLATSAAHIGGILAPFSSFFAVHVEWGPAVVFGVCCLVVSFLSVLLPETRNKPLPQTFNEVEELNKEQ